MEKKPCRLRHIAIASCPYRNSIENILNRKKRIFRLRYIAIARCPYRNSIENILIK
jgi:Zn ribbon nucleic-acid-binding protein